MTYNYANELTQVANSAQGTEMTFTYDAWGRTATKAMGGKSAQYGYRYGSKLYELSSDFFDEDNVTFDYGGDGRRRLLEAGGVTMGFRWDADWNVINAFGENGLARTYFHAPQGAGRAALGHVDGANPASGAYRYYTHDHLGSTRGVYDQAQDQLARFDYTPYGEIYHAENPGITTRQFTGHDWSPQTGLYFAPYRYYNPAASRWLTRDPLGMADGPNVYAYVRGNPISAIDFLGLCVDCDGLKDAIQVSCGIFIGVTGIGAVADIVACGICMVACGVTGGLACVACVVKCAAVIAIGAGLIYGAGELCKYYLKAYKEHCQ